MTKSTLKKVTRIVTGYCVSAVTSQALRNVVPVETPVQKTIVAVGTITAGIAVSHYAGDATDQFIDDWDETIKAIREIG